MQRVKIVHSFLVCVNVVLQMAVKEFFEAHF